MSRICRSLVIALATFAVASHQAAAQDIADIDYEYLSFRGIALEFGYLWPDRVEKTESYGLRFDLGYAGTGLRVVPSIMYWSSPLNASEIVEFEDRIQDLVAQQNGGVRPALDLGTIEYTDIAFGLDAQVVWELPLDVLTFGGVGVTAHVMDGDGDVINGTFVEDLLDSVEPGFNLHLGTEYPIAENMRIYASGRYEVMPDLQYLQVRAGWQFMWGPNAPGEGRGSN
jgi:opacity protein-like surface antigen